jgi:amidase
VTVGNLWDYWTRRGNLRNKYHQLVQDMELDGIICPVTALPSTPHHMGGTNIQACVYTMTFNILELTAGVVPFTKVLLTDTVEPGFKPKEGLEASMWATYTPELYQNTPVSLQIVGKRLDEERVLALMDVSFGLRW